MSTIILGIVALVLLFGLSLFAVKRFNLTNRIDIFNTDDALEAGLFGLVFVIVLAPVLLVIGLVQAIWFYEPPKPLPVEGDDPFWGRNVNKKVVERAFLTLQEARMRREPDIVKDLVATWVYSDLKGEADELKTRHEINTRKDVVLTEVIVGNESIFKSAGGPKDNTFDFDATIHGTMTNFNASEQDGRITSGSEEPQEFKTYMLFHRGPAESDRWLVSGGTDLPKGEDKRAKYLEKNPN